MMAKIVVEAESNIGETPARRRHHRRLSVAETICEAVAHAAEDLDMRAIAIFTETGNTARLISKYRPIAPIYAFSHVPPVCNRMNLFWGVHPLRRDQARTAEDMVRAAEYELVRQERLKAGDVLGVVAGTQMSSGSTNFMRLRTVREAAVRRVAREKK